MLSSMRKNATSLFIKILLGAIVVVFAFFGVGSFQAKKLNSVAMVNDEAIEFDHFKRNYDWRIDQLRRQFGGNLDDEMLKMFKPKQMVMNQLIEQKLLTQEAKKQNIIISDNELSETIKNMPYFKNGSGFDNRTYNQVLTASRLTPEIYEAGVREELIIQKLRNIVMNTAVVTDAEAKDWFFMNNKSVKVKYLDFNPEHYSNINVTEEDTKAYYDKHTDNYKSNQMAKINYVRFNADDYKSKVNVPDDEVAQYFENNKKEFDIPKTVSASHILVKVSEDADEETVKKAKDKIDMVYKLAKEEGSDFAALAKEYSEGPTRDKGGELGTFRKESMVKPFADKAFSMTPGEISEPVRTQFGFHIIKVDQVNPEQHKTLDEVKDDIVTKLTDKKAKELAEDNANQFFDLIQKPEDFEKTAENEKLKLVMTDFFEQSGPKDSDLTNPTILALESFKLADGEMSTVIDLKADGYAIIHKIESKEPEVRKFEDVKEAVMLDANADKRKEKAKEEATAFLAALKATKDMPLENNSFGIDVKTTDFFKKNDRIPEIGYAKEFSEAAFALTEEKPVNENVVPLGDGFAVMKLEEIKQATEEEFNAQKKKIKDTLIVKKRNNFYQAWIAKLKAQSKIHVDEKYLN